MSDHFVCVLPFDTDDPEFVRGIEVGRLWEMLKHHGDEFVQEFHATNSEMVLRMAEATGRTVTGEVLDEPWMRLHVDALNMKDGRDA